MRLLTGKRIGQSQGELAAAVSFSLFLHVIAFSGALYLSFHISGHISVPAVYRVNLVNLPTEMRFTAPAAPALPAPERKTPPAPPKPMPAKVRQPAVHAVPKPVQSPKESMPPLEASKPKPEKPAEAAVPATPATPSAGAAGQKQPVSAVGDVKLASGEQAPNAPYVAVVRNIVERNWNPPPGVKGLKATVIFSILRSGRVGEVRLAAATGNSYFDQAAKRAILSSNFPSLPHEFFKDAELFSVDLMERE